MLPIVSLAGSPRAQGVAHGRALSDRIEHNLAVYRDRFAREGRLSVGEVHHRSERYWHALQAQARDYADGVRGIAEGSGQPLLDIVALNVRYEILYHQFVANARQEGCTAFAALPPATLGNAVLMGQNWDWIPQVAGAVLRVRDAMGAWACFTEAGIFGGKIGCNAAGIGLAVNGMTTTQDDWSRLALPFHARTYEVLRASSLEAAVATIEAAPRACSANFVIGHRDGRAIDIETAPAATCRYEPLDGALAHANHFLDPAALEVAEPPNPRRPGSCNRLAQMRRLLAEGAPHSADGLMGILRDHTGHPDSVCRHVDATYPPEQHYRTVTSVVMDLGAGKLWLTDGPPCASDYTLVTVPQP